MLVRITRSCCESDQKLSHMWVGSLGLTTWKVWHINKIFLALLFSRSLLPF